MKVIYDLFTAEEIYAAWSEHVRAVEAMGAEALTYEAYLDYVEGK